MARRERASLLCARLAVDASARVRSTSPLDGHGASALARYNGAMRNEFTAIIERDGKWFVAYCAEVPGANGQGRTKAAARKSLAAAIALILRDRRADALRGLPRGVTRETVTVE